MSEPSDRQPMRLDRNVNRGGRGKYAIVNMRKLVPIFAQTEQGFTLDDDQAMARNCFEWLVKNGYITLGNEAPSQQFFLIKFGDKFTLPALRAYAMAITSEMAALMARGDREKAIELVSYYRDIEGMIHEAAAVLTKLPD